MEELKKTLIIDLATDNKKKPKDEGDDFDDEDWDDWDQFQAWLICFDE